MSGLLGGFEIKTKSALVAAGFGLEGSVGKSFDLELALVGRVLTPTAYTALVHAERSGGGSLCAVVADNIRGLHET